ncbi:nucleotidyltransferase family protein [Caldimonas thermodepolymerans]|uniref:Mannose-1-phosphate guanylyltransferase n=1 Tax=Caldimonas thermodepolymerans TaxID=215580 RepID=A0A2S5T3V9_9BURK|nr:nucleotidyltransferase family protein [Caldimonas thermodepolymerans]PPE69619.1 mannose-1-phosphate guanylyltransferase [Caldimonas thermodepolymerans]QPC31972.1 nucleotidyltransferase family protein [Caldimonas thermodepolymerans]RDI01507.1 MurNAc alpha-1-phosphate uridylyltransferase [Caldimonas thermodepolymerans]
MANNLKAIVLAAGRGERMRPLTDRTPKPLLPVGGKPLIVWHLEALARDGVREVVVNTAWLEEQIPAALGDGSRWGLKLHYSMEGRDHGQALETAGGIAKALPWLGECFWVVSGDIHAPEFRFDAQIARRFAAGDELARLWLVPNPPFHPAGDFGIDADGFGLADGPGPDGRRWTYSNLALMRADLCAGIAPGTRAPLGPLLRDAMRARRIRVERHEGRWENVGTPAQLDALNAALAARAPEPLPPEETR